LFTTDNVLCIILRIEIEEETVNKYLVKTDYGFASTGIEDIIYAPSEKAAVEYARELDYERAECCVIATEENIVPVF
jgi:hypothetical protein